MSRRLGRVTTDAVIAGTVVLASLLAPGRAGAQGPAPDVFQIGRFAQVNTTGVSPDATVADTTVRITNPGATGLRAWGTHVENSGFVTETPFQTATLSSAELGVLADKCGGIGDNGSGFGVCRCGTTDVPDRKPPSGTLCALLYVFTADQQLAECCGCPVTPNGLLVLSVKNDLTSNPLTVITPQSGVIKLLSSTPPSTGPCDAAAPMPPPGPTTTVTSTTVTSTTVSPTTTTTSPPRTSSCFAKSGFDRLDCELQAMAAPLCDFGAISPPLERRVLHKLTALRSRLERTHQQGSKAFNHVVVRTEKALSRLQQVLANAVGRRIDASCQARLNQQLDGLRGKAAALRE